MTFQAKTIKLSNKTGIPIGVLPAKTSSKNITASTEPMQVDSKPITGPRPKCESKEDKVQRKQAVKEQRRVGLFCHHIFMKYPKSR